MQFAKLKWINQQPYSLDFNDVYYSSDDGLTETEYVFIEHNQLVERFLSLGKSTFTVIETGFGTGLNCFCAIQHFINHAPADATLKFISIERYPLKQKDFIKANQNWPIFSALLTQLEKPYAQLTDGRNQLSLCGGRILLDCWIGDVTVCLPQIQTSADAWFLDGFAPSKNADMWSETLFDQLGRLSQTNTSFATFTSAGEVKRQLQRVGFQVEKTKGYGKKREMLCGTYR